MAWVSSKALTLPSPWKKSLRLLSSARLALVTARVLSSGQVSRGQLFLLTVGLRTWALVTEMSVKLLTVLGVAAWTLRGVFVSVASPAAARVDRPPVRTARRVVDRVRWLLVIGCFLVCYSFAGMALPLAHQVCWA